MLRVHRFSQRLPKAGSTDGGSQSTRGTEGIFDDDDEDRSSSDSSIESVYKLLDRAQANAELAREARRNQALAAKFHCEITSGE